MYFFTLIFDKLKEWFLTCILYIIFSDFFMSFLTCILYMIFSPFFHVICHAKSERLSWCQNRTLFRTDDFLSSILFYSDSSDSFSVRRSRRTTLFLRFVFRETSHCTYVPIWLTYACMLKNKRHFRDETIHWLFWLLTFKKTVLKDRCRFDFSS